MIKQPAWERKCLLPLNSIAVGYRHAEERDGAPGTTQCPPPDMLPACDAGIYEHEYRRRSPQSYFSMLLPRQASLGVARRRHRISGNRDWCRACNTPSQGKVRDRSAPRRPWSRAQIAWEIVDD